MKNITFSPEAFEQFNNWATQDKKIHRKIITLLESIIVDHLEPDQEKFAN